jgi:uncharacterized damage-inducible protein DinB
MKSATGSPSSKSSGEIGRLLDQFQRAWDGEAWYGPPVLSLLQSVGNQTATFRPAADAHTIQELASHMAFWLDAARRRAQGERYLPQTGDWDLPAHEPWDATVERLRIAYTELTTAISALDDSQLATPVNGKPYDYYVLLHGALQHTLYHAGQIAMVRRLAGG